MEKQSFEEQTLFLLNKECEHGNFLSKKPWLIDDIKPRKHRNYCCESIISYILCGNCKRTLEKLENYQNSKGLLPN